MIILGTREAGVKIGTPKSGVPRARSLQLARMRLCHVHSFFTNMSLAVALLMLGWAIFALLGLLSSAVFRWRAAQTQWPFRNPEVLALTWFYSFDVSRGDYFSAIFYAIFFGWIFRRSKVKNPLTLSQQELKRLSWELWESAAFWFTLICFSVFSGRSAHSC